MIRSPHSLHRTVEAPTVVVVAALSVMTLVLVPQPPAILPETLLPLRLVRLFYQLVRKTGMVSIAGITP